MSFKKVALVTGSGARRLGWHVADALAQKNYALVVHYHTSAAEAAESVQHFQTRGVDAFSHRADLADEAAVRGLIQAALDRFGRIDVLVNCASIWERKSLDEVTAVDVRRHFEINVLGTFLCARHAGLAMARQPEGGCIINLGDWAEARPYADYSAYFASKGAVPALTRSLAVELGGRNPRVRVNCILPGPVLFRPDRPEVERQQAIQATLVRRQGRPENIAQAVHFLIDNDFVTGISLPVDGGRSIYAGGG